MKTLILVLLFFSPFAQAAFPRERFFANPSLQKELPAAFALQKEALSFLLEAGAHTRSDAANLVEAVRSKPALVKAISGWKGLSVSERELALREVFALEVAVMGVETPELVIAKGAAEGGAFFEFDLSKPSNGKVILSPEKLDDQNFESLAFLIHETRHSSQLQRAFGHQKNEFPALAAGYLAAFSAQKELSGRLGFCDFLTLLNEYEAFLFGNLVVAELTNGAFDMMGMGTFASQQEGSGAPKVDLLQLHHKHPDALPPFNVLEEPQYEYFNRR